jgi:hypothetical protein
MLLISHCEKYFYEIGAFNSSVELKEKYGLIINYYSKLLTELMRTSMEVKSNN